MVDSGKGDNKSDPVPFCNLGGKQSGRPWGGGGEWERMCINRWLVFWSDGQSGVDSAARSEHEKESGTMFVEGSRSWHLVVQRAELYG